MKGRKRRTSRARPQLFSPRPGGGLCGKLVNRPLTTLPARSRHARTPHGYLAAPNMLCMEDRALQDARAEFMYASWRPHWPPHGRSARHTQHRDKHVLTRSKTPSIIHSSLPHENGPLHPRIANETAVRHRHISQGEPLIYNMGASHLSCCLNLLHLDHRPEKRKLRYKWNH